MPAVELFVAETAFDLIKQASSALIDRGENVAPRGLMTRELQNVTFVLTRPRFCWAHGIRKKLSIDLALAEALQLSGAFSDPHVLGRIAPNMRQFQNGGVLEGAYGQRVGGQLKEVVKLLKEDPTTRQAVLTIRDPYRDLFHRTADVPCTIAVSFRVRDGKLYMTTHMRSNDIMWGVPYDIFQFCFLQMTIANELDLDLGDYVHHADSLHMYRKDFNVVNGMTTAVKPCNIWIDGAEQTGQRCMDIFYGREPENEHPKYYTEIESSYVERMKTYAH